MGKTLKVLVADDDPVVRGFLGDVLRKLFSCEVLEASTVADAVAKTGSAGPDLVLVDRNLSDGTLEDYCRGVSALGRAAQSVPKWVVSGEKPLDWDARKMRSCGVLGYLLKPCRIDDLRGLFQELFPGGRK